MNPTESGYQEANDIQLYYEIYGTGEPVVLIHGGGSSGFFDFEETIKRLSDRFQLITIDLQNHGRSGHRDIPETFEQDAKDVVTVLDHLNIAKASFFGFSNGATTVLNIASSYPERTEKIIVASGVTKRSGMIEGFFEGMNHATINNIPSYLKNNFLRLNPDPEKLQNMFEKDSQRMIHFQDWEEGRLSAITAPTFFIAGDKDVMTIAHVAEMSRLVPHSRLMVLPAAHGAYMMADEHGNADDALIDWSQNASLTMPFRARL